MAMDFIEIVKDPMYALAIAVVILTLWYMLRNKYKKPLPPGPNPLPIIGNLLYLKSLNLPLYQVAMKLRAQYGDIVRLKLGPSNVIFIMGRENIYEAAVENNNTFKYRPSKFFMTKYIFDNKGILLTNGETNAALRKYVLSTMRDFGVGKRSLEERIQEEANMLCKFLESKNAQPFYFMEQFKMCASNIIAGIIYGDRFDYDDPVFQRLISDIDTLFKNFSIFLPENSLPLLRFLPGSKLMKIYGIFKDLEQYARSQIEEHRATFDPDCVRDFVDIFLKNEGSNDPVMTEQNLFRVIVDLFNAGTDTTATTLLWGVVHWIRHPDVQAKCRAEVLRVVGTERSVRLEDKRDLPYLVSFIDEVLRYSAVAPQTVPHSVLEDTEFHGYTIPKDSVIMFILYSVLHDKKAWGDPENFRPERYLMENGERKSEISDEFLTPFGLGGRSCIGKHLARMEIFLFFGTLIQRFEFKAPPGAPLPSDERIQSGITSQPKKYDVCAIPYVQ